MKSVKRFLLGNVFYYENGTITKRGVKIMAMVSIAKKYVDLQKRATNNLFDTVTLFQDFADDRSRYWVDQMGVDEKMKDVVDEWRMVFKKGRKESIKMVNDGFKYMETYLDDLSHVK
jgi:hypothetical protein